MKSFASILILAAILAPQDDAHVARWIDDLGHDDISKRELAERHLTKAGPKVIPALNKALASKNAETVARVRNILREFERLEAESHYDAEQRRQRLELLTFDEPETRLGDLFAAIERQTKYWVVYSSGADRRVRVGGRDQPIRKVLDAIESQLDVTLRIQPPADPKHSLEKRRWSIEMAAASPRRSPTVHLPGLTIELSRRVMKEGGIAQGWLIECDMSGLAHPFLHSVEVRGTDQTLRAIEACGGCGPRHFLIRGNAPEDLKVRIRGESVWHSIYTFEVAEPAEPKVFRVGALTINYDPTFLRVQSPEPMETYLFGTAGYVIQGYQESRSRDPLPVELQVSMSKHSTWCSRTRGQETQIRTPIKEQQVKLEVASEEPYWTEIRFAKPIREPFDQEILIPAK